LVQHQILRFLYPYQALEEIFIFIISAFVPSIYWRSKHSGRCNFSVHSVFPFSGFPVDPALRGRSGFAVVPDFLLLRLSGRNGFSSVVPVSAEGR
jgi:hypothetical protein